MFTDSKLNIFMLIGPLKKVPPRNNFNILHFYLGSFSMCSGTGHRRGTKNLQGGE